MVASVIDDDLDRYNYLGNVGTWPRLPSDINPEGWLANFSEEEQPVALELLKSLIFMNAREFRQAIASSIKMLSASQRREQQALGQVATQWKSRLARMVITVPLGSQDDPTSSGYMCLRIVKELGFPEERILVGQALYRHLEAAGSSTELILLDDLAASGNQFKRYWTTQPDFGGVAHASPEELVESGVLAQAYYLPVVATRKAIKEFTDSLSGVDVLPTYTLGPEYSAFRRESTLVSAERTEEMRQLIETYYPRTGASNGPYGYRDLGLTLSFEHGTPNNTLPILAGRPPGVAATNWTYLRSK